VCGDLNVLDQSGVAPDGELVIRGPVARDNLAVVGGPLKRCDLGSGVDRVHTGASGSVPEVNLTIEGTSSGSEKIVLPRAPSESLDGCLVVGLAELGSGHLARIPNVDQVIVAAGSELGTVGTPLEAADLGGVREELSGLVFSNADIVVEDVTAAGAGRKSRLVPGHDTNTGIVAGHGPQLGALLDIPDLNVARAETHRDVGAILRPPYRRNVCVGRGLEKAGHRARLGVPDVDVAFESDSNLVTGAPVEEIEVVVIDQARRVEYTLGSGKDAAAGLRTNTRLEGTIVLRTEVDGLARLRGRWLEGKNPGSKFQSNGFGNGCFIGLSFRRLAVQILLLLLLRRFAVVPTKYIVIGVQDRVVGHRSATRALVIDLHSSCGRSSATGRNETIAVDADSILGWPRRAGLLLRSSDGGSSRMG